MIELQILGRHAAGQTVTVRRFPFVIGRHASDDLRLNEPGIWDRHLRLDVRPTEGISLTVAPEARAAVNGQLVQSTRLRNGDLLQLGGVRLRFSLAATRQRDLRLRESLTWLALAALCAAQIGLLYRL
jgi:pSer/pThr/pTyr-binding forkhead associated (FHA) protein